VNDNTLITGIKIEKIGRENIDIIKILNIIVIRRFRSQIQNSLDGCAVLPFRQRYGRRIRLNDNK